MNTAVLLGRIVTDDIFALRRTGRDIAALLGLDHQDQVRVATALSEVGRELLTAGSATVEFRVASAPQRLEIVVDAMALEGVEALNAALSSARRLMDDVELSERPGRLIVTLTKCAEEAELVASVRDSTAALLATSLPASPLDALRDQNEDLVRMLDEVSRSRQDLLDMNSELEETNRGVMALYGQLSDELEETNRGVVALYAELDAKGEQLAKANEAKTRFLRSVSHELRSPVTAMLGLADLLRGSELDAEQRRQVDYLCSSAQALLGLVNELLDLARAESNHLAVRFESVDLGGLFVEMAVTLGPLATARGIHLRVDNPDPPLVRSDRALLARVLRNLVNNAISFTEAGEVRVTCRRVNERLEIAVADTGIGILPEHQGMIFEEFFQVPGPLQARRTGTGLGLPYARRVVEALGGRLELSSVPGQGSTFTLIFPLQQTGWSRSTGRPRVLIVDDDSALRLILRAQLEACGADVSEAASGRQGLAIARELQPDLILLDLRMPELDGIGVLAELREDPDEAVRDIRVVLMTSADIDAEVARAGRPAAAIVAKRSIGVEDLASLLAEIHPSDAEAR